MIEFGYRVLIRRSEHVCITLCTPKKGKLFPFAFGHFALISLPVPIVLVLHSSLTSRPRQIAGKREELRFKKPRPLPLIFYTRIPFTLPDQIEQKSFIQKGFFLSCSSFKLPALGGHQHLFQLSGIDLAKLLTKCFCYSVCGMLKYTRSIFSLSWVFLDYRCKT